MSRTDRHLPFRVVNRLGYEDSVIKHDHSLGYCKIAEWHGYATPYRTDDHTAPCPKRVLRTHIRCVHDKGREVAQKRVDTARSGQKTWEQEVFYASTGEVYQRYGSVQVARAIRREKSSKAINQMLCDGYIPNCLAEKTHDIPIEEFDMRLNPYETANFANFKSGRTVDSLAYYHSQFRPSPVPSEYEYLKDVYCDTCDRPAKCYPTYVHPNGAPNWGSGCGCCDYIDEKRRSQYEMVEGQPTRNALRNYAREYNTFGYID